MTINEKARLSLRTLVARDDGSIDVRIGPSDYVQGMGLLLAVNEPRIKIEILGHEETTKLAFIRVGNALSSSMDRWVMSGE